MSEIRIIPTPPDNLTELRAIPTIKGVQLSWQKTDYHGNQTEIFRSEMNDFSTAVRIAVLQDTNAYMDNEVNSNNQYYYWGQHVLPNGATSRFMTGPVPVITNQVETNDIKNNTINRLFSYESITRIPVTDDLTATRNNPKILIDSGRFPVTPNTRYGLQIDTRVDLESIDFIPSTRLYLTAELTLYSTADSRTFSDMALVADFNTQYYNTFRSFIRRAWQDSPNTEEVRYVLSVFGLEGEGTPNFVIQVVSMNIQESLL